MGEEALDSINHQLSQLRKANARGFIYRVHEHLRNVNSKSYEPRILSVGPYHRDKDSCKMMEEQKLRYLQSILDRKKETTPERYISAIAEVEQEARSCYAEPITLSRDSFIKMLVLDGCFIIELVRKAEHSDVAFISSDDDPVFHTEWITNALQRDLILFENQIPFFVLCKLFDLIEGPETPDRRSRLIELLKLFCMDVFPDWEHRKQKNNCSREQKNGCSHDIKHLLDLMYNLWIPPEPFENPVILNSYLDGPDTPKNWPFIHSATKLKDANVKFKKRERSGSSIKSLFEVTFQDGILLMPPFIIEDMTECCFRNCIAYEQYFPNVQQNYVTDYVVLLDLLIDSSKDVDVLSECGIIDSWLGNNERTADMFNKLAESIVGSAKYGYGNMSNDIIRFYNRRWNRWMAVLNRDYLSSPWASISLFAAFAILLLTIVQAACSVLQVVLKL